MRVERRGRLLGDCELGDKGAEPLFIVLMFRVGYPPVCTGRTSEWEDRDEIRYKDLDF